MRPDWVDDLTEDFESFRKNRGTRHDHNIRQAFRAGWLAHKRREDNKAILEVLEKASNSYVIDWSEAKPEHIGAVVEFTTWTHDQEKLVSSKDKWFLYIQRP